ncbi:R-spondin-4 isoform X1 [Buteo buteo]|uniref:R-spondin-4 isoform X1 n=1 Tax=Buteo buteo TaxID=30397 RepID=UPI003EBEE60B
MAAGQSDRGGTVGRFPAEVAAGALRWGSMEMLTQNRWKKQASAGLLENCTGCVLCSEDNGCITCHHRLFLLIWRDGIRQYGMCVHTCPPGYFGVRGLEVNRCTKCRSPSCESCFSRDFCMKCKDKFYLHKGQCFRQCPPSTTVQPGTRECQGKQHPHPVPAVPGDVPRRRVVTVPVLHPCPPQRRASRDRGASGAPAPTRAGPAAASGVWRHGSGRCRGLPGRRGPPVPRCWRRGSAG